MSLVFPHTFVPWFRAVAPHIHAYHGKTFVVAIAGELIAAGKLSSFAQDLAILHAMGIKLVLVHGFRPQVNEQLRSKGHEARYSHGLRITDAVALDSAQEAAGQLRFEIEAAFSQGLPNTPMANAIVRVVSGNFLTARPVGIVDGVDFIHSGVVRKVDAAAIRRAIDIGAMVLLSPFGFSPTGEAFNLTMEDVATSTADRAAGRQAAVRHRGAGHPRRPGRRRKRDRHRARAGRCRAPAGQPAAPRAADRPGVLPAALRAGLPRRRGALAHPAVRDGRRAADGGVHARRHRHDGGRREAREPARGDVRRHRRRAAADRAVRAGRHAGQARAAPRSSATSATTR